MKKVQIIISFAIFAMFLFFVNSHGYELIVYGSPNAKNNEIHAYDNEKIQIKGKIINDTYGKLNGKLIIVLESEENELYEKTFVLDESESEEFSVEIVVEGKGKKKIHLFFLGNKGEKYRTLSINVIERPFDFNVNAKENKATLTNKTEKTLEFESVIAFGKIDEKVISEGLFKGFLRENEKIVFAVPHWAKEISIVFKDFEGNLRVFSFFVDSEDIETAVESKNRGMLVYAAVFIILMFVLAAHYHKIVSAKNKK